MTRAVGLGIAAGLLVALIAGARTQNPKVTGLDLPALREINRRLDLVVSGPAAAPTPIPPLALPVSPRAARVSSLSKNRTDLVGHLASRTEFALLLELAGQTRNGGRVLTRERLERFYNGSLLYEIAQEAEARLAPPSGITSRRACVER